jgi:hypothetical protein
LAGVGPDGKPSTTLFEAADGIFITQAYIHVANKKQLDRIVTAVESEFEKNRYGYSWPIIEGALLLSSDEFLPTPISHWTGAL